MAASSGLFFLLPSVVDIDVMYDWVWGEEGVEGNAVY